MSRVKNIFVTGVTGFVGCHLAYELLEQGHRVIGLARDGKDATAAERALAAITEVGQGDKPFLANFTAVAGNVEEPAADLISRIQDITEDRIDEVWHCVATFKFKESEREEIRRTNIEGTKHILELVERVNLDTPPARYFHVSTAYSSGQLYDDYVPETINENESDFRSLYEWSKNKGEAVVDEHQRAHQLDATIFRPAIIVGSKTTNVISYSAYYQVCEALYRHLGRLKRRMGDAFNGDMNIRLVADADARINFVPIDYVIQAMLLIAAESELVNPELKIFNVVNEDPPKMGLIHEVFCQSLGVHGIKVVEEEVFSEAPMNAFEKVLAKRIAFQAPYMFKSIKFSTDEFRRYVSFDRLPVPQIDREFLLTINKVFFDSLERARQNGRA